MKYKMTKNDYLQFPYYYQNEIIGDNYSLYIMDISLKKITDIIKEYSKNYLIIHDVSLYAYEENIGGIAKNNKVDYKKYDNDDHIIINKKDFDKLVDFSHSEYYLFDTDYELTENDFFIFREKIVGYGDVAKIPLKLQYSNIWLYTHDDSWLYTESKSINYIKEIKIRFFETLIKRKLKKYFNNDINIILFDNTFIDAIKNNEMTIINKCYKDDNIISFPIAYKYIEQYKIKYIDVNNFDELIYDINRNILLVKNNI